MGFCRLNRKHAVIQKTESKSEPRYSSRKLLCINFDAMPLVGILCGETFLTFMY